MQKYEILNLIALRVHWTLVATGRTGERTNIFTFHFYRKGKNQTTPSPPFTIKV